MNKEIILIGVCTYNRPIMLEECLQSLVIQQISHNVEIIFCVADNNSDKKYNIAAIVSNILKNHPFEYVFVEKRGISFARNAVLDAAIKYQADYIAFIDDDEYASHDWLEKLYHKIKTTNADAVQGLVTYNLPVNTPDIIKNAWTVSYAEETVLKYSSTNNIIFHKKLIQDWHLRFAAQLALTGGEDIDFFLKSKRLGGKHIFTNTAVVYETLPAARLTKKWQLKRKMQDGFAVSYVMYLNNGLAYVLRKYVIKAIKNLILAPFCIMVATLFCNEKAKFKESKKLFYAFGCMAFIFKIKINSYKKVTGN